jgi:hypothetical protein
MKKSSVVVLILAVLGAAAYLGQDCLFPYPDPIPPIARRSLETEIVPRCVDYIRRQITQKKETWTLDVEKWRDTAAYLGYRRGTKRLAQDVPALRREARYDLYVWVGGKSDQNDPFLCQYNLTAGKAFYADYYEGAYYFFHPDDPGDLQDLIR